MEQLQSHIWLMASSYMVKYLGISSYGKPFLIYEFTTARFWISLYIWGQFYFIFYQCTVSCTCSGDVTPQPNPFRLSRQEYNGSYAETVLIFLYKVMKQFYAVLPTHFSLFLLCGFRYFFEAFRYCSFTGKCSWILFSNPIYRMLDNALQSTRFPVRVLSKVFNIVTLFKSFPSLLYSLE